MPDEPESQSPDLVAFLKACVDEDERVAKAAIVEVGSERVGDTYSDGSGPADRDSFPSYPWGSAVGELEFMAGPGHPERVLAEVAAKRRIIDLHGGAHECSTFEDNCTWIDADYNRLYCDTLRLLASVYAGRPGWRAEWAPPS